MINLSNYEEYFLLYIDNELGNDECASVEAFVLQHPHLAAELHLLQGTKLPSADALMFNDKATLYKAAGNSINLGNCEEYFLLHTDKELSASQEEEVEQFVLQHPQLQEAFLLLQKTRLIQESVECSEKDRLYKQPAKRVIPLYITRMAVAAAVAGLLVVAGKFLVTSTGNPPQVAINPVQKKLAEKISLPTEETDSALLQKKQPDMVLAKNETKQTMQAPVKTVTVAKHQQDMANSTTGDKDRATVQVDTLPLTRQAMAAPQDLIADNQVAPKQAHATAALKPLEEISDKDAASTVMYVSNDYTTAKPAVYKELNTDDDDQTLYVGSLQLNKARVNGLFKKATHLLGNKNKDQNL